MAPRTPLTQPRHGRTSLSCLFFAVRGRKNISESKYSSISVCHLSIPWTGLPVRSHVAPTCRIWPYFWTLSSFPAYFNSLSPQSSCKVKSSFITLYIYAHFCLLFLATSLFSHYLFVCLQFFFSSFNLLPTFLYFGAEPAEEHQHTEPGPNLPLCLSVPGYACLCLGLWLRPAPITLLYQHIYCTCLLATSHPYTVPLHLPRDPGREN